MIAYVTSTRPNFDIQMALDVIPIVYEHLRALPGEAADRKIDLFLHSNGGDGALSLASSSRIELSARRL